MTEHKESTFFKKLSPEAKECTPVNYRFILSNQHPEEQKRTGDRFDSNAWVRVEHLDTSCYQPQAHPKPISKIIDLTPLE